MATPTNTFVFVDPFSGQEFDTGVDLSEIVKTTGVKMICPVKIGYKRDKSDLWTFPLEPIISVRASKTIARRNVAKMRSPVAINQSVAAAGGIGAATALQAYQYNNQPFGTIKEQFSLDDYEITISGLLQSEKPDALPTELVSKLNNYLRAGQSLMISAWILDILAVDQIVVESWEFPHTAGQENQEFSIRAYSDFYFELL